MNRDRKICIDLNKIEKINMTYFEELIKKAKEIKNPVKQVLAVSGSPRKGGNIDIIIKQIVSGLNTENITTENTSLRSIDFSGCIG
ncbi:hypothetical protein [Labilibaculum sp.]|uniref:hypothetical protein n=1 Tax=Labilibaculum sp. TaxID=2060723 RepID=UPI003568A25F